MQHLFLWSPYTNVQSPRPLLFFHLSPNLPPVHAFSIAVKDKAISPLYSLSVCLSVFFVVDAMCGSV